MKDLLSMENRISALARTHSSVLAWRIPATEEPAVYGVTQSQTWLKRFSSSSSSSSSKKEILIFTYFGKLKYSRCFCLFFIIFAHWLNSLRKELVTKNTFQESSALFLVYIPLSLWLSPMFKVFKVALIQNQVNICTFPEVELQR